MPGTYGEGYLRLLQRILQYSSLCQYIGAHWARTALEAESRSEIAL